MDSTEFYTFYDIQKEVESYFANRDKGRGSGYKQYKRWAIFAEERFSPSGEIFNIGAANLANYQAYISNFNFSALPSNYDPGYWSQVNTGLSTQSPSQVNNPNFSSNPGVGRVQCIEIAGSDCYIGTPGGGIWKNSVSGSWVDWIPIGDGLPQIGISDIEVNPNNSNNIFILTGEADQSVSTNESIGVLESNDGGLTWHATSLSWDINELVGATRLLMHPTNPNIQFVTVRRPSSRRGIYKTTDGWNSWTQVYDGGNPVWDIEFKPGDPSIVYASTNNDFLRSTSNGDSATFNIITNGLPSNPGTDRIAIGVSPDDADYVYLLYADNNGSTTTPCSTTLSPFDGFYRSTNSGVSFILRDSGCPNPLGYSSTGADNREQATYDLALAVNPNDVNEVHIGGINCWMSTTGGNSGSWTITSWWDRNGTASIPFTFGYTHADIHALEFSSSGKLYCASDGGFYRRSNGAWSDRSNGLMNMQFYNIDVQYGQKLFFKREPEKMNDPKAIVVCNYGKDVIGHLRRSNVAYYFEIS